MEVRWTLGDMDMDAEGGVAPPRRAELSRRKHASKSSKLVLAFEKKTNLGVCWLEALGFESPETENRGLSINSQGTFNN